LRVEYPAGRREPPVVAVDGVDLDVARGTTLGLVGESGSGKSSIGNTLLGLAPVSAGTIEFDGTDVTHAGGEQRRLLARRMQAVFQDPYGSMNPTRTVADTVGEALRYNLRLDPADVADRVAAALAEIGLAGAADRYPGQFSGGQRQRLAIARAIAVDPDFLVCDEPVSALDLSVQAHVLNHLATLTRQRGLTSLFISHDIAVVRYLSDEIAVMFAGRVVEHGPAAVVADQPAHPYTRALLAAAPVPDPDRQAERRQRRRRYTRADGAVASEPGRVADRSGCVFAERCPFVVERCRTEVPRLAPRPAGGGTVACHRAAEIDTLDAALDHRPDAHTPPAGSTP